MLSPPHHVLTLTLCLHTKTERRACMFPLYSVYFLELWYLFFYTLPDSLFRFSVFLSLTSLSVSFAVLREELGFSVLSLSFLVLNFIDVECSVCSWLPISLTVKFCTCAMSGLLPTHLSFVFISLLAGFLWCRSIDRRPGLDSLCGGDCRPREQAFELILLCASTFSSPSHSDSISTATSTDPAPLYL